MEMFVVNNLPGRKGNTMLIFGENTLRRDTGL